MNTCNQTTDSRHISGIQQEEGSSHQQIRLNFKELTNEVYFRRIALRDAEIWTGRKIDRIYLKRPEMWC